MFDLRQGDAFELIKTIPENTIDFVLTDPPYEFKNGGFGAGKKPLSNRAFKKELFKNPSFHKDFNAEELMCEIERVSKKVNCIIFGTDSMMYKLMKYAEEHKYYYTLLFWHKKNPPPYVNNNYLKDVELSIMIREKGTEMYGNYYTLSKFYESCTNIKKDIITRLLNL